MTRLATPAKAAPEFTDDPRHPFVKAVVFPTAARMKKHGIAKLTIHLKGYFAAFEMDPQ